MSLQLQSSSSMDNNNNSNVNSLLSQLKDQVSHMNKDSQEYSNMMNIIQNLSLSIGVNVPSNGNISATTSNISTTPSAATDDALSPTSSNSNFAPPAIVVYGGSGGGGAGGQSRFAAPPRTALPPPPTTSSSTASSSSSTSSTSQSQSAPASSTPSLRHTATVTSTASADSETLPSIEDMLRDLKMEHNNLQQRSFMRLDQANGTNTGGSSPSGTRKNSMSSSHSGSGGFEIQNPNAGYRSVAPLNTNNNIRHQTSMAEFYDRTLGPQGPLHSSVQQHMFNNFAPTEASISPTDAMNHALMYEAPPLPTNVPQVNFQSTSPRAPSVHSTASSTANVTLEKLMLDENVQWGYCDRLLPISPSRAKQYTPSIHSDTSSIMSHNRNQQWVSYLTVLDRGNLALHLFAVPPTTPSDPPAASLLHLGFVQIRVQEDIIILVDDSSLTPGGQPEEWVLRGVSMKGPGNTEVDEPNKRWGTAFMECVIEGRSRLKKAGITSPATSYSTSSPSMSQSSTMTSSLQSAQPQGYINSQQQQHSTPPQNYVPPDLWSPIPGTALTSPTAAPPSINELVTFSPANSHLARNPSMYSGRSGHSGSTVTTSSNMIHGPSPLASSAAMSPAAVYAQQQQQQQQHQPQYQSYQQQQQQWNQTSPTTNYNQPNYQQQSYQQQQQQQQPQYQSQQQQYQYMDQQQQQQPVANQRIEIEAQILKTHAQLQQQVQQRMQLQQHEQILSKPLIPAASSSVYSSSSSGQTSPMSSTGSFGVSGVYASDGTQLPYAAQQRGQSLMMQQQLTAQSSMAQPPIPIYGQQQQQVQQQVQHVKMNSTSKPSDTDLAQKAGVFGRSVSSGKELKAKKKKEAESRNVLKNLDALGYI